MRRFILLVMFAAVLSALPTSAYAAEATLFGPIVPPECNCENQAAPSGGTITTAPDWGCVMQTVQNGMNFAVMISIIIVLLFIVYAGALFMLSAANPENRKRGRQMVANAFIGMLVVMAAWLFVDFLMKVLYNPQTSVQGVEFGPWNAILGGNAPKCIKPVAPPKALPPIIGSEIPVPTGTGTGSAGGTCTPPTGGPCSVASLQNGCFAAVAAEAAQICSKESGGNPQSESKSDRLATGEPYSIGLFQINLTNSFSQKVNGKLCKDAFSEPCQKGAVVQSGPNTGQCRAKIIDPRLYHACVAAAKDATTNITEACKLYRTSNNWGRWQNSAISCNLPH